ncbi:hypothetical protein [Streptomyces acidiscabies]|uniref:Uncharacterized protein n=1 Tax=Streptomyces acidiscabies TaxID=42234 RepID=A0ABU4LWM8_9ACTN|nr:hypothetical protein [Streptomyces acidiscabies]MDX3020135.1 hypothetical protein [Streptomyces acidiscabies]
MNNSTSPSWPPADQLDQALAVNHAKGRTTLGLYLLLDRPYHERRTNHPGGSCRS